MSTFANSKEGNGNSLDALVPKALGLIGAYWSPHLINTASELNIYDILSKGPMSNDELAKATGAHSLTLFRFMRALSFLDVFKLDENQKWTVTPLATVIFTKLKNYAVCWIDTYSLMETLTDVVKTGKRQIEKHYGLPYYKWCQTNPRVFKTFNYAMSEYGYVCGAKLTETYDFSQFKNIVDVGGGRGIFLSQMLRSAPNVKGTLYDQPEVVQAAQDHDEDIRDVRDRITFVGGSFLSSVPSGGDCYTIRNVLNDYDDENALKILKNIAANMNDKSKLIIIETEADTPWGSLFDLQMFILLDGITRSEEGFKKFLPKAGLRMNKYIRTGAHGFSIIEVVKIKE